MNTRALLPLTLAILATGACSTRTAIGDLEDNPPSQTMIGASGTSGAGGMSGAAGTAGTAVPKGPYVPSGDQVLTDPAFTNPSGISGDWVGYIENGVPGSEEVLLRFGTDANGNTTLSVKRGTASLPAAPTDPFAPWPAGKSYANNGSGGGSGGYPPQVPMLGFTSAAHGVTWTASRLKFRTLDYEPWGAWCALQTPYSVDGEADIYNCMRPDESVCTPNGCTVVGINGDANHWMMCNLGFCGCNATGCGFGVRPATVYDITFFGDHATGAVQTIDGQNPHSLILMPAAP